MTAREARHKAGVYRLEFPEMNWRYVSFGTGYDLVCVNGSGEVVNSRPSEGTRLVRVKATTVVFTLDEE